MSKHQNKIVPLGPDKIVALFPPIVVYTVWQLIKGEHKCRIQE